MEDLLQVGIITGTHGLKGEVKVFPTTDDKERFLDLEDVLVEKMGKEKEELVMYTCYPFYAITGRKTQRLTVFADRVEGYNVKWRNMDE